MDILLEIARRTKERVEMRKKALPIEKIMETARSVKTNGFPLRMR